MSKALMLAVWDRDLPHPEKCVLAAMAYNGDDNGQNIWPSVSTIARRSGYKVRQVHNIIRRMKEKGILQVEGRMSRKRGFVTVYSINLSGVPLLPNPQRLQFATNQGHDAVSPLGPRSVQSARASLQTPAISKQLIPVKSATASAEEQYLIGKEQEGKVFSQFSISRSQKHPLGQQQPQTFDVAGLKSSLRRFKQMPSNESPLNDDVAYRRRIAELKSQEECARQIAERYKLGRQE